VGDDSKETFGVKLLKSVSRVYTNIMSQIISIANQKGGVGKTTTAINLSAALAKQHQKVLLVDFDSQGNAGRGLGIDVTLLSKTVFDALTGLQDINSCIVSTSEEGLFVLPSNLKLASLDTYLQANPSNEPFRLLSKALAKLTGTYDYIIIDCPPSLGLLSLNALVASMGVIIPVQCEYFAMEALAAILSTITRVQNDYNPNLRIEGFLLTMYDPRTSLGTEIATQVRGLFKENTFLTAIPRNISLPESCAKGLPVGSWRPTSQGAVAYAALAREVLDHDQQKQ
jgi:chromosome partitioning protein